MSNEGPGQEPAGGVEERGSNDTHVQHPDKQDSPDEGPSMTGAGASPSGSSMDHWATGMPNTDATKPETMPDTKSTPLPGETEDREPV